jgi:UDP-glucose 4-epimerase
MILVTGGAGYIGAHTNKLLVARGRETVVLDNLVYGHREFLKWGQFVLGDLSDEVQLDLVFERFPIEAVLHFAAFAYVGESVREPDKYYANNVAGTLKLLQAMRKHGVGKIVFSSTCATYGHPRDARISECTPQQPINPYGRSKFTVEGILADYAHAYGLRYVALRYFNAAGADPDAEIGEWHDPETHLIPLVLDVAAGRRRTVSVFGTDYDTTDGTCVRDYVHVSDLADAHVRALDYLDQGGDSGAFNLGTGRGFSVAQVIETARLLTGHAIPTTRADRRPGDPTVLVAEASRARETLGWVPAYTDLADIVSTAWRWHQRWTSLARAA